MDLNAVEEVSRPSQRDDLWPVAAGDAFLAGGTWLFSEPQPDVRRLIDLTQLDWPPITMSANGIELSATCPVADVARLSSTLVREYPDWTAAPLFRQCCTALLASQKIWRTATIGGNVCLSFPAGSMISLAVALDGEAVVWRCRGDDYTVPVARFVTGSAANVLEPGDVLRAIRLPAGALRARTAYAKIAPSALGRSAAVVIGRRDAVSDGGRFVLSVTAATVRPFVFELPEVPDGETVRAALATIPDVAWTRDVHGDPDWRCAVTRVLAQRVCAELA